MKIPALIALFATFVLCTACPGTQQKYDLDKILENNMDLPELGSRYYKGLSYELSDLFQDDYDASYVIGTDAETYLIYDIGLYFSVEFFSESDADVLRYVFDEVTDPLNAVHDNYILKRLESMNQTVHSVKKELPESVKYPGFIQVVHGDTYSDSYSTTYFTATLKANDGYYVFQMIGPRQNMGYIYDDFIALLSSVKS